MIEPCDPSFWKTPESLSLSASSMVGLRPTVHDSQSLVTVHCTGRDVLPESGGSRLEGERGFRGRRRSKDDFHGLDMEARCRRTCHSRTPVRLFGLLSLVRGRATAPDARYGWSDNSG